MDVAIEILALAGLLLVPLVFRGREWVAFFSQPKFFVLHLVALSIVVLWLFELARADHLTGKENRRSLFARLDAWLANARHRWAVVSVAGFGIVFLSSTLLSPLPWVSVWGRDFGDLGYELYSTLAFLVIFFAIALRVHTREQVIRVALVIAAAGTVSAAYGVSQHFGWDPIGRGSSVGRVLSSLGNPLFLGAYLVMSIPVVAALALQWSRHRTWVLVPAALAIGLQFAAIWLAGGRGSWIAAPAGFSIFVALVWMWIGRSLGVRSAGLGLAGGLAAVIIVALPSGGAESSRGLDSLRSVFGELTGAVGYLFEENEQASTRVPNIDIDPRLEAVANPSSARTASFAAVNTFGGGDSRSLLLSGRPDIWRGAVELAIHRNRVEGEPGVVRAFRTLFGFGPDMYFYSYPTTANPQSVLLGTSHAHNYPLQVLMEQGLIGLVLFVITAVLVLTTAIGLLRRQRSDPDRDPWISIIVAGLIAALIGRAIEQSAGVGRVSDLMLSWALMGLVIASAEVDLRGRDRNGRTPRALRTPHLNKATPGKLFRVGAAVVVAMAAVWLFIVKDFQPLQGGWIAANGFEQKADGQADQALRSFQEAIDLAPDVERYYLEAAGLLSRTAARTEDDEFAIDLYGRAREVLLKYEDRDPLAWATQLELAAITADLTGRGQDVFRQEAATRYTNVSNLMAPYAPIQALAADRLARLHAWERALPVAERAIALEAATAPLAQAWWAYGETLFQLGQFGDALLSFETAVKRQPSSIFAARSHRGIANLLEKRGEFERAAEHQELADAIEGK